MYALREREEREYQRENLTCSEYGGMRYWRGWPFTFTVSCSPFLIRPNVMGSPTYLRATTQQSKSKMAGRGNSGECLVIWAKVEVHTKIFERDT